MVVSRERFSRLKKKKNRRSLLKLEREKSCNHMHTESVGIVLKINITSSDMFLKCVKILDRWKTEKGLTKHSKGLEFRWAAESQTCKHRLG